MTNNKKLYGFVMLIFIVLTAITAILVYFAYNITQFTTYGTKTAVGSVYIGGLYGDEATKKLNNSISDWKKDAVVKLTYQGYEITLDNENFIFYVRKSIEEIKSGTTTNLHVSLNNESYLSQVIQENYLVLKFNKFDYDQIEAELLKQASLLYSNIKIDLGKYTKDYETNVSVLNQVAITFSDPETNPSKRSSPEHLSTRINFLLKKITIAGNSQFNLKEYIETEITSEDAPLTELELNIIATGIYQLILDTNFYNIKKFTSDELPNYVTSGIEALIDEESELSFFNPNPFPYYVTASLEHRVEGTFTSDYIIFTLSGAPFIDSYSHAIQTVVMLPGDIYWYYLTWNSIPVTNDINYQTGSEGYRSFVIRNTVTHEGVVYSTIISEDIYMPKDNIYIKRPVQNN